MRSEAAESSRETVRMKGGQSKEVGSRESQREGWKNEGTRGRGKVFGVVGFGRSGGVFELWPRAVKSD